jgi:ABC-type transport system substrate-binding protein
MMYRWFWTPKSIVVIPLLLALAFIIACGGAAATAVPQAATAAPQATATAVPQSAATAVPQAATTAVPQAGRLPAPTSAPTSAPVEAARPVAAWVEEGAKNHYNGQFPLFAGGNPGFWDTQYTGDLNSMEAAGLVYNQLFEFNPVNPTEVIGDLVERWELNEAGNVYTFRLHDTIKNSDGTPFGAEDIVFSLDRITLPGALRARTGFLKRFYEHKTATVIDEKTLRFPLKSPSATIIQSLASDYAKMYPKGLENVSQDDFNCCPDLTYGSGPWVFKDWKVGASYSFTRNPFYFKAPRPFFDGLDVFVIIDSSRRLAAMQAGQVFGPIRPWALSVDGAVKLEEETNGQVRALEIGASGLHSFWLNHTKPPFDDPRVRRAMFLAVDRAKVIKLAYQGYGVIGTFFYPGLVEDLDELPSVPGYRTNRAEDIAEAKALLEDAGYTKAIPISVNTVNRGGFLRSAEILVEDLLEAGLFDLTLSTKDTPAFYVSMRDGTFDTDLFGTGIIHRDPSGIMGQLYDVDVLRNPQNWTDPSIDDIIARQDLELDPAKRLELFKEMVEILREGESHQVPIMWYGSGAAFDYRVRNYFIPPTRHIVHKWDHVWFDQDREQPAESGYVP